MDLSEKGVVPVYMGGLGNQLWTVSAAFCVHKLHGCPLYIPTNPKENNRHNLFDTDYTNTIFKHIGTHVELPLPAFAQMCRFNGWKDIQHYGFNPWSPEHFPPGSLLNSYFQYYPPLKEYETELRTLYQNGLATHREELARHFATEGAGFVHVRRGDYVGLSHIHYSQPPEYYATAIRILTEKYGVKKLFVLSDDIEWVQTQSWYSEGVANGILETVNLPHELDALAFMSLCTAGAICANSTFSWWGAFLGAHGERSPVIVPTHWISDRLVSMFPEEWIELSTAQIPIPRCPGSPDTACVVLTDSGYLPKALKTIQELRGPGRWDGDVVLLTVDCSLPETIRQRYRIHEHPVERINTDKLVSLLKNNPIKPMPDNRHFGKMTQWTKFRVFERFLKKWKRIIFFDAGIRFFDSIQPLLDIPWKGRFIAPDDCGPYDNHNRFRCQLDGEANPSVFQAVLDRFGSDILDKHYFLNCLWIYDTDLLDAISVSDLEDAMNAYPISLCNEMGILNLFFTFALKVWSPMPLRVCDGGKMLFGWSDTPQHGGTSWKDYHIVKYARTA